MQSGSSQSPQVTKEPNKLGIVAQTSNLKILESEDRRENYNSTSRKVLHSHEPDLTNHIHFEGISFMKTGWE